MSESTPVKYEVSWVEVPSGKSGGASVTIASDGDYRDDFSRAVSMVADEISRKMSKDVRGFQISVMME